MEQKHTKDEITRKEALQRMGKYAALTALGTFIILNPKTAHAQSPPDCPIGDCPDPVEITPEVEGKIAPSKDKGTSIQNNTNRNIWK